MARVSMEELVSVYNESIDFDNKLEDVRVYIFKDKEDLINKYVNKNLLRMKIDEPISGEKYDDTFKKYLEEVRLLCKSFSPDEIIVVGVFGKYTDGISINKNTVHLYHMDEINLLVEDVEEFYKN